MLGLELRVQSRQMRFYDPVARRKLLTPQEEYLARQQAETARQQAEERAQRLAEKLRELNIDPDSR